MGLISSDYSVQSRGIIEVAGVWLIDKVDQTGLTPYLRLRRENQLNKIAGLESASFARGLVESLHPVL